MTLDDVIRHLRTHHRCVVIASAQAWDLPFVLDPHSGDLVVACPQALGDAGEVGLGVPDDSPDSLQFHALAAAIDTPDAADRFRAYHGRAPDRRLSSHARLRVMAAKRGRDVLDLDRGALANPLAGDLAALCRLANDDTPSLAALIERAAHRAAAEPVAVGVDPMGIDVRTRTGLVRAWFAAPATTPGLARERLRKMLGAPR